MLAKLFITVLLFVVHLDAFAETPLQKCRQLYSQGDFQASFDACLPLAEQGNGEAGFILSNLYTQGVGGKQPDLKLALVWLHESARQGHAAACFNLAALYERGKVIEQDYALAYSWYEKGAQRGHTGSQFKVGIMSLQGIGTEVNAKKALAWMDKAAESGNQDAQVTLATLLSASYPEKSFDLYNRAADQGNSYAYSQLAEVYAYGKLGQPVKLNEALYLAQKSVILGRADSQELVDTIREKINQGASDLSAGERPEGAALDTASLENSNPVYKARTENNSASLDAHETDAVAVTTDKSFSSQLVKSEDKSLDTVTTEAELTAAQKVQESQQLLAKKQYSQLTESPTEHQADSKVEETLGLSSMHKDKAWLMAQPSEHYVLQLAQFSTETSVKAFLKQMGLDGKANYYHAHTNAGRVYVVLYSKSYPAFQAAKNAARQSFSTTLQKDVWYRRYKDLQTSYRAP